ncbi:hypothetical protein Leryth_021810 [Lithospermum erythrorhizon]|nr:hypothetical protein Leryth_021810 [Lithospermum erythrorhizon]
MDLICIMKMYVSSHIRLKWLRYTGSRGFPEPVKNFFRIVNIIFYMHGITKEISGVLKRNSEDKSQKRNNGAEMYLQRKQR